MDALSVADKSSTTLPSSMDEFLELVSVKTAHRTEFQLISLGWTTHWTPDGVYSIRSPHGYVDVPVIDITACMISLGWVWESGSDAGTAANLPVHPESTEVESIYIESQLQRYFELLGEFPIEKIIEVLPLSLSTALARELLSNDVDYELMDALVQGG